MRGIQRPVIFDADAVIRLLECDVWGRVCKALGSNACLAELVAKKEVRGHRDRVTRRWRRFKSDHLSAETVPRLLKADGLTPTEHEQYIKYFASLDVADPGERETFAFAWVLGYDVCSRDVNAKEVFFTYRPEGCTSQHMDVMDLLRRLRIIK